MSRIISWKVHLRGSDYHSYIPDGYTLVRNVVLPEHKAVIVNEWGKMTAKELKKLKKQKNSLDLKEESDTPNE